MSDQNTNPTQDPPLVTTNADPNLPKFVEEIENDLLLEIMQNIQTDQITQDQAQKLAQEFLALLPITDKQELLAKLKTLGQNHTEARQVYNKYIATIEEEKRQQTLEQMREHIQTGNLEQALNVAKGTYGS